MLENNPKLLFALDKKYADIIMDEYPLVYIRIRDIEPTVEHIHAFFDELDEALGSQTGEYISISDNTLGTNWLAGHIREVIVQRSNDVDKKYEGRNQGAIVVLNNASARLVLRGINLFLKRSVPQVVVANEAEARLVAAEMLDSLDI